ncbi:DUF4136 domain-containing protein [Thiomicrorhabdus sp. Kp2]|uniref:DUF4136 domain-containing protein n=1 Tax=Thiomicrorhabdus sp. Kp2 TaxID=1123518 RepID=UPI0004295A56|nr:DUF4136 domain-containing protein [Thiomicrorhabdus sp. Kp2]
MNIPSYLLAFKHLKLTHLKLKQLIFIAVSVTLLSACSSIPVTQDYSNRSALVNHQTYQWLPSSMQTSPSAQQLKSSQPFITQRIEKAIMNNLHQRGALMVREAPQAYVSYHYSVSETQVVTPNTTIGFGWHSRNIGFGSRFPMDYDTETYRDAKWAIDIYDANGKLIWRGETTRPVESFSTPQESEAYTQKVVDAIMQQYPPK